MKPSERAANDPVDKVEGRAGIPIDKYGGGTIDPTANVLSLFEMGVTRLNDLAAAETRRVNERFAQEQKRVDELQQANDRRQDDLRRSDEKYQALQQTCATEMANLRAEYTEKLATAESKRVDANRSGDVGNVAIANERANLQATALQNQVQTTAEAQRAGVTAAASTMDTRMTQSTEQLLTRIAALENKQSENMGKSGVTDPQMNQLIDVVNKMALNQANAGGVTSGTKDTWTTLHTLITTAIAALGALGLGLGVHFIK